MKMLFFIGKSEYRRQNTEGAGRSVFGSHPSINAALLRVTNAPVMLSSGAQRNGNRSIDRGYEKVASDAPFD
ncbi:MAG: hypothetical protein KA793_09580 [Bacteroidales bacterium]|nr:hypothetical protein [Bacteroidales bacterium]